MFFDLGGFGLVVLVLFCLLLLREVLGEPKQSAGQLVDVDLRSDNSSCLDPALALRCVDNRGLGSRGFADQDLEGLTGSML
jgi:hypothetical protein